MKKSLFLAAVLTLTGTASTALAQGIIVNKNDGSQVYFKATDIKSITTFDSDDTPSFTTCPDDKHPHLIDLGLPSGTKWACCNLGATKPEEPGKTYAWGETEPKTGDQSWTYYLHYDRTTKTLRDIGSNIAGTIYDAATANWGGIWRMPTLLQIRELIDNTTTTWVTTGQNGSSGIRFTSANGGSIFLPMGYYSNTPVSGDDFGDLSRSESQSRSMSSPTDFQDTDHWTDRTWYKERYWSSSISNNSGKAYTLNIYFETDKILNWVDHELYWGNRIRPVQ